MIRKLEVARTEPNCCKCTSYKFEIEIEFAGPLKEYHSKLVKTWISFWAERVYYLWQCKITRLMAFGWLISSRKCSRKRQSKWRQKKNLHALPTFRHCWVLDMFPMNCSAFKWQPLETVLLFSISFRFISFLFCLCHCHPCFFASTF